MTEEPQQRPAQTGPFEHYCGFPGCRKWGGYGFARGGGDYDWFCYEHRPDKAPAAGRV